MVRGDKGHNKGRGGKNSSADKKKTAVHKMVEALIVGDSDAAAEELHTYLQMKTRDLILGEMKHKKPDKDGDGKPDWVDDDDDDDDDDDEKKSKKKGKKKSDDDDDDDDDDDGDKKPAFLKKKKGKKEKVEEGFPKANLTKSRKGLEKHSNLGDTSTKGNSLRDKPKTSNDTKARKGLDKHSNHGDTSDKGNVYKKKPHKANLTKARKGLEKHPNHADTNIADFDDGRDRALGTCD